jgi:hypothetical protein
MNQLRRVDMENKYYDQEAEDAKWDRESEKYDEEKDRALIEKYEQSDADRLLSVSIQHLKEKI